ncbi:unnamed protein product, partial [Polarella glacialis]
AMAPAAPRLAPLGNTFLHNASCEKPRRRHSFSGYLQYDIEEQVSKLPAATADTWPGTDDECEGIGSKGRTSCEGSEAHVGSESTVWPDTDDEWEGSPSHSSRPRGSESSEDWSEVPQVIVGLGKALAAATLSAPEEDATGRGCFHHVGEPLLDIDSYLRLLYASFGCSEDCFVMALAYMGKVVELHPAQVEVNFHTVHRLLLTALTVAVKLHGGDSLPSTSAAYARAGGLDPAELR